ncbi:hypothetical protein HOY82DRAFT_568063 [Tuber indicum]|nr:hypothetical protein HOY82DRAFT_568063 [Tuber indicum]
MQLISFLHILTFSSPFSPNPRSSPILYGNTLNIQFPQTWINRIRNSFPNLNINHQPTGFFVWVCISLLSGFSRPRSCLPLFCPMIILYAHR